MEIGDDKVRGCESVSRGSEPRNRKLDNNSWYPSQCSSPNGVVRVLDCGQKNGVANVGFE